MKIIKIIAGTKYKILLFKDKLAGKCVEMYSWNDTKAQWDTEFPFVFFSSPTETKRRKKSK